MRSKPDVHTSNHASVNNSAPNTVAVNDARRSRRRTRSAVSPAKSASAASKPTQASDQCLTPAVDGNV
jgi:hypothetical protein